jgi:prephenate dehydratase
VPADTNPCVVDEVERGAADYGVIPIENPTAGPVIIGDRKPILRRLPSAGQR